ncbi:MAG: transporter ATP-binding protein [Frankiales bacterium]|nr:transporter ATP-binding protein [Frankiales bacterium]
MSLLEVHALQVAYGGVVAVRDVSLDVAPGQVTAVLGANGAGKTTTLLGISGLVRARAGEVLFDGQPLLGMSPTKIARLGIAHVPAGRGIFPGLSVQDNLRMGLYGAKGLGAEPGDVVEEVLEQFPILRERRAQPAGTMSGGQQQQLAIGRALVQRPRLLMLDEMSMGLSPRVVADLFVLVARLATEGMAIVMVEQFVGQALKIADQAVVIEQGRVVASGAPSELSAEDIGAAYLGGHGNAAAPLPGAPRDARQPVVMSLAGVDVRRLERKAAQLGVSPDELAQSLLEKALDR